jgi:multiple sugar transport system substrate-binding protein
LRQISPVSQPGPTLRLFRRVRAAWALQQQQQEQYPDLGATPIRTDLLTPSFSTAHPLDAVALKALARGYAPVTLIYNQAFNEASGPWFQMFQTAVYDGNKARAGSPNPYSRRPPKR